MSFTLFSRKTMEENIKQQLIEGENLQLWWQRYCNSFTWLNFKSHYTKQMDTAIDQFQQTVDAITAQQQQQRRDALHRLYDHVLNWLNQHSKLDMNSNRYYQISQLHYWIDEQLCQDTNTPQYDRTKHVQNQHIQWHLSNNTEFDSKRFSQQKNVKSIQQDIDLYKWWQSVSQLRFYQYRSSATKQLDEAIKWYCNSVIIDKIESLDEILSAINCWKTERALVSDRLDAVLMLEQQIKVNITFLQQNINSSGFNQYDQSWKNSFAVGLITLQTWFLELTDLFELDTALGWLT